MKIGSKGLGGVAVAIVLAIGLPAHEAQAQEVRVENAATVNGVHQVAIGSFVVAFLTDRTDRARAGGGLLGGGFGGRSTARTAVEGVGEAEFQRATDAAYEDFVRQLTAAGYTVADPAPLAAAVTAAGARPLENGLERDVILGRDSRAKARLYSPSGWAGPMLPVEALGMVVGGGFTVNRSAFQFQTGAQAYARDNGAGVVNVLYVIDFANAETYGGWFRNSSAVSVNAGLAVVPDTSKLFVYPPRGRVATVTLREPVAVGGDFGTFGDTTTGGQRMAETAANVIGVLGGIGTNSTRRYTMQADPERWTAGVGELSTAASARMIQALRAGR